MDNIETITNEIKNILVEGEKTHGLNTLEWVKKLSQEPSHELQVAALSHDIDRSIEPVVRQKKEETYDAYKHRHSLRSSKIIKDLLMKHNLPPKTINKISELVKNHEIGGDAETNILQDADSISFFDNNLEGYIKRNDIKKSKEKSAWMFNRCSPRAQRQIKTLPTYQKFTKEYGVL